MFEKYKKFTIPVILVIVAIVAVSVVYTLAPDPLLRQGLMGAGVTNLDRIQLDGTTDPVLDLTGNCLDLDADNDTSICADTDDQVDIEMEGADQFVLKAVAGADSTVVTNAFEVAYTTPIDTTGTQTHNAFVVDVSVGASTGGTNVITALQVDAITGDNNVTETAINLGTGWDSGITSVSPVNFNYVQGIDSAATGQALEVAFTSPVDTTGTNTHNAIVVDLAIGASSGGTNVVTALQIDDITGQGTVTENALMIGTGFDVGIDMQGVVLDLDADNDTSITSSTDDQIDFELEGSDQVVFAAVADADSGTTNEYTEIAFTSPVDTTGTQTHNALTVDLAIGASSGGTNVVTAIQVDDITGQATVTENGLIIGTGFDQGATVESPADFTYVSGIDSGVTADALEVAFTSPVDTTGTQEHNAITVDLGIGASSGGTNTVNAIKIDDTTGQATVTETGLMVGTGFDVGIDMQGIQLDLDADGDTSITASADDQIDFELEGADQVVFLAVEAIDSGTTNNYLEVLFTTPVDTGGTQEHNAINVDLVIGDATGGTNTVNAVKVDNITGDAEVTETGLMLGTGYDVGIDAQGMVIDLDADGDTSITASTDDQIDIELEGADQVVLKAVAGIDSATTTDSLEIAYTTPVDTTGENIHNAITVDIAVGASTGGENLVTALQIDDITGDPQVVESAIEIGADWDYALDTAVPVVSTAQTYFDDFLGDAIRDEWIPGSGAQAGDPALNQAQFGTIRFTTEPTDNAFADDFAGLDLGLHWSVDQGSFVFEIRLSNNGDVTGVDLCVGMLDTLTEEMYATIDGSDVVTISSGAGFMFCYDDTAATDQWFALGGDSGTAATGNGAVGVAPSAGVFQTLRIEVDAAGNDARYYIDGILVKTLTANVENTVTTLLTPSVVIDNGGAGSDLLDVDYIYVSASRD